jgi:hypothetical protein
LKDKFDKDLSSHLTPYEKAIARAFLKLNEESMRWAGVVHRFRYGKPEDFGFSYLIFKYIGRKVLNEAYSQGYARHTKDECKIVFIHIFNIWLYLKKNLIFFQVYEIGLIDLKAFEDFLGDKKYLMGDKICNEDASMFGGLAQVINHDRGPFNTFVMSWFKHFLIYLYKYFICRFF